MKETLLIIDDDFELVNALKEALPAAEGEIIHAFDYRGVSKVIARQKVSTVVLNLMLPDISGFSFLEDLRINRPMPILATGSATAEERIRAYLLGADLFMQKPIDPMELVAAIHALLRRYYALYLTKRRFQTGGDEWDDEDEDLPD